VEKGPVVSGSDAVVKSERAGAVALVIVDSPPVNALGHAVRSALKRELDAAIADPAATAVVLLCAGRTFIAGADIAELGKPRPEPLTPTLIATIEASPKPVIAALHGTALGGGFELALGCHYRVAAPDARVGLPEVKLGILPGAGGTQRLPRVVGVPLALDMITSGDPIGAALAHEKGIIDEILPGDLRAGAIAFAERAVNERLPLKRVRDLSVSLAAENADIFGRYRADFAKRKRGLLAPQRCIAAVEASVAEPFDEGLATEARFFAELVASEQAKAQRHLFFAERDAAKIPDLPSGTPAAPVRKAAVIGAGTMGGGIAMCFANAGIPVTVIEASQEALDRGLGTVRRNYETSARRGSLAAEEVEKRMALLAGATGYEAIADADIVIEAVFEDLALKRQVFAAIDRVAKPEAVLATNTSYLDLNAIATATPRPQSVVGMHFFSPANVMRLVEVVRGQSTAAPAIASAMALARKLRKVPVLAGVCDGFIGNRMLAQRSRAAERLLLDGASPQEIDRTLYEFGFPMGPFAMSDLAGIDISWRGRQARGEKAAVADALYEAGRLGQKTGAGYYRYEQGSRTPLPDPDVDRLVEEIARGRGIERRPIAAPEILERLLFPMINEGARILAEGIALRPGDIDVVWAYGYGWPVYRGGPMFYADQLGLAAVRDSLAALAQRLGEPSIAPAPLLERLAAEGRGFADWSAAK
jgi:3-hydroxyacyl-CoA dehydrogenase